MCCVWIHLRSFTTGSFLSDAGVTNVTSFTLGADVGDIGTTHNDTFFRCECIEELSPIIAAYQSMLPLLKRLSLAPLPIDTADLAFNALKNLPLLFLVYVTLVFVFLIVNCAWINLLALSYLGDISISQILRSIGRKLIFDFGGHDAFSHRAWLRWAERVRARSIFFLDKLARQDVYQRLKASTLMRTQYDTLSAACFVPICTNLLSPWKGCLPWEEKPEFNAAGMPVMLIGPDVECWSTTHIGYCVLAMVLLSLYIPVATSFAAFAEVDSNGQFLVEQMDVRFSPAIRAGDKAAALVMVFCKQVVPGYGPLRAIIVATTYTCVAHDESIPNVVSNCGPHPRQLCFDARNHRTRFASVDSESKTEAQAQLALRLLPAGTCPPCLPEGTFPSCADN